MLQRSTHCTLRQAIPLIPASQCARCRCRCGRTIWPFVSSQSLQARSIVSRANRAPSTKQAQKRNVWPLASPVQIKERKQRLQAIEAAEQRYETEQNRWMHHILMGLVDNHHIQCSTENAMNFFNACSNSVTAAQNIKARVILPKDEFRRLQEAHDMSDMDVVNTLRKCLLASRDPQYRQLGKSILFAASRAGNEAATIRIMHHAYVQEPDKPRTLQSSEIDLPRTHLREIAEKGHDFKAMVLQGNIDYLMGKTDSAIELWTKSVPPALEHAEQMRKHFDAGEEADLNALTSPWIELANVHERNGDYREAKQAFMAGCEADDPNSHYQAAMYFRQEDPGSGAYLPTSKYVYHMTKAAASGWVPAMHALGLYYSGNSWPYIEDDPPDYIKPTPFDRYPPDDDVAPDITILTRLQAALGLGSLSKRESKSGKYYVDTSYNDEDDKPSPADDVFNTAASPSDPEGRYHMALQWLDVAMGFGYAPSYLVAAKLHLETELGDDLAAPKEAINLSPKRYSYASRADYEAGRPVSNPIQPVTTSTKSPFYDRDRAKELVREIFYAAGALNARVEYLSSHSRAKRQLQRQNPNRRIYDNFGQVRAELPVKLEKWFVLPDLHRHWMDEERGLLRDSFLGYADMVGEARKICDGEGWDIYAEHDGGLLYRHLGQREKGMGMRMVTISHSGE